MYLSAINSAGNVIWHKDIPSRNAFNGCGINVSPSGDIYLDNEYQDSVGCGSTHLGTASRNDYGFFLAKLSTTPNGVTTLPTNQDNLILYPNPTTGNVTIRFSNNNFSSIKITDQLGKVAYQAVINDPVISLDLSSIPEGIYFAQFANNKASVTKKLVIRH